MISTESEKRKMKKVPLGVENFVEANELYYVDKTRILKDIIDSGLGKTMLFTRPRRFGKSLALSMMECFFTDKTDYRHLFEDKEIFHIGEQYRLYANAFPVIRLNMKDVSAPNLASMLSQSFEIVSSLYRNRAYLFQEDNLFPYERKKFDMVANRGSEDPFAYTDSIRFLCELLHRLSGKKVIILIDEYDTPLENAFQNGFYDQAVEFFKRLYSNALKANDHILFAVVTGVLQISNESIFSELNNLNVFNFMYKGFMPYFGFTKEEVKRLCEHFEVRYDEEMLHHFYGGYGEESCEIYNPWSILSYIDEERYGSFWVNTGSNKTVQRMLLSSPGNLELLNCILASERSSFLYSPTISYKDVSDDANSLLSYLVQCGYLVATPPTLTGESFLRIPNEEIRLAFQNEIIGRSSKPTALSLALSFKSALMEGKDQVISDYLRDYVLESFSYYDLTSEKEYQTMLLTLFAVLFEEYVVKSEVNNRFGRCDIMLLPKDKNLSGVIIELKSYRGRIGKKRLEENANKALLQIKENQYYSELKRHGCKKNLIYAFCFERGNHIILHEEI